MQIAVVLCDVNDQCWQSKIIQLGAKVSGLGSLQFIHAALLVDTSSITPNTEWVYDLTLGGVNAVLFDEYDEPVKAMYTLELDETDLADLRWVKDILARYEAAETVGLQADWSDLLRLCFRKPLINHTCVSFVRYLLGYEYDENIRTCDDLAKELENGKLFYRTV